MSDFTPAAPIPAAQEPQLGPFARLVGVLVSPVHTFRDIVRKPDWIAPMVVIFAIALAAVIVTMPRLSYESMREQALEQAQKNKQSPEQVEKVLRISVSVMKSVMWVKPLFALGGLAVFAAIYFLGVKLAGGEGSYLAALAVTAYAQMPMAIHGILNGIVAFTKRSIDPQQADNLLRSNLAFLADFKTNPAGWVALASLDVFAIWSLVLLILGFAELPRMTRGRSTAVVVTIRVVLLLFGVGMASISMLMRRHS